MATAKSKVAQPPVDVPARVAQAHAQLEAEGVIKLSALGAPAVRGQVAAALAAAGFELTKSLVRKPIDTQLKQALADGAFIPLKRAAAHLAGTSAPEANRAALALVASGAAHLVLRGKEEVLVPANAGVLSRKELAAFDALAKVVKKVASAKNGLSLLRSDLSEALTQILPSSVASAASRAADVRAAKAPADPALTSVLSAVDATRDAHTGLSFVPSIVARLQLSFTSDRAREALLEAAHSGLLELRPEGGINRLSAEELSLCPPGPQGTRLSWARRTENDAR